MTLNPRRLLSVIMLLSVAGVVVSSVSLYHHYDNKSESSYCDFGGSFNCDIVNRSIYSKVFDVPVALIGIVGYLALAILVAVYGRRKETIKPLLVASIAGLAFALRLTYIEGFVLAAWCVLCLTSLVIIFSIALLAVTVAAASKRSS